MDTKTQILSIAADLLQKQSMNGFSLQDVADRVGIRKPSLFHHYRNKDALVADVIESSIQAFRKRMEAMQDQPPARRLETWLSVYVSNIGAGSKLCPVGGILGDWDHLAPDLQQRAQRLLDLQQHWLEEIALSGKYVHDANAAQEWAEDLLMIVQGALVLSRVRHSPLPLERAVTRLRERLASEGTFSSPALI
ncbi:MAG TPA: TetR/AcrR family transcriptional regulator [Pseudomonas xinjiangensis]|uniref:TetR/AcrR family transcriptional regulator n=2 Tax=root TaxID=1 RepID=A0A7V1FST6_9GAMM|nr:TetR/AcrR family transcriptional regulator [Halopseudomonas xinjiangensis]HEC47289.1 TetR/AcrR family transcriptional regulator [Halopseudomonas xinjiangensis]